MPTRPSPAAPAAGSNWTAILFGFLLAVLAAFQQFKLPPLLPGLLEVYAYPKVLAGGFMSIYAAVGLLASIGLGRLLQTAGTLPVLMAAFAVALAGNLLALAEPQNGWIMLASRGLEGLAFAVFAIAGPVYTNRNAGARHLPIAIALSALWIPVGQLLANALVPFTDLWGGWRLSWMVTGLATVALAAWMLVIRARGEVDLDLRSQPAEGRQTASGEERWALTLSALIFTLWSTQYFAYMTWLPQFLVEGHGLSPQMAAIVYSLPIATLIVVGITCAFLIRRGAPIAPMLVTSIVLQASVWWTAPLVETPGAGVVSLLVYGVGIGITPVCLFALPSTILGARRTGPEAFAILMTGRNLGVLIGPVLLPQILIAMGTWDLVPPIFGSLTVLAAAGAVLLGYGLSRAGRLRPD